MDTIVDLPDSEGVLVAIGRTREGTLFRLHGDGCLGRERANHVPPAGQYYVVHPFLFLRSDFCPFCGSTLEIAVDPMLPANRDSAMCRACGIKVKWDPEDYRIFHVKDKGAAEPPHPLAREQVLIWGMQRPQLPAVVNPYLTSSD